MEKFIRSSAPKSNIMTRSNNYWWWWQWRDSFSVCCFVPALVGPLQTSVCVGFLIVNGFKKKKNKKGFVIEWWFTVLLGVFGAIEHFNSITLGWSMLVFRDMLMDSTSDDFLRNWPFSYRNSIENNLEHYWSVLFREKSKNTIL